MNFSKRIVLILLLISISFAACVKELDFDQANDLEITPTLESSLVYFEIDSERAVEEVLNFYGIDELPPIELFDSFNYPVRVQLVDTTSIDVFNSTFYTKNLTEADILYQFTNSTITAYDVEVHFLTEDNLIIYDTSFIIEPGSIENPIVSNQIDNFTNDELISITNTAKMSVNVTIHVDTNFLYNPEGSLLFKSSGTFYFLVDEE